MTRPSHAGRALAALMLSTSAPLASQALPGEGKEDNPSAVYFVKNNARVDLRCRTNSNGAGWGNWFALRAGGEFYRRRNQGEQTLSIYCDAPALFASYRLTPGKRYVFLMRDDGKARLVRITA